ncbi:MAG: bifunctional sulfate adenylyltransferase/adenylylsulfate kinase [Gemmatimonadetes bacterium]|nr:bifunctional sulfate adenylyltransferase/adenylylsulfate kinase [Gemmatimonadota bacterium]
MSRHLIQPHGGELKELLAEGSRRTDLREASRDWPSWGLTDRQTRDLELLMNGGFSPLGGFLDQEDYRSVVDGMRLSDGTLWPIPVTLDVTRELAEGLSGGQSLALRDREGVLLAVMTVGEVWEPDRREEAEKVFGTTSLDHPGVDHLLSHTNPVYVGGVVEGVRPPVHYDFKRDRHTPRQLREEFSRLGWRSVVGFHTRNPMHRAQVELTLRAARAAQANLLIHPVVRMTQSGDLDHYTRVRCYEAVLSQYPQFTAKLSLLDMASRLAGPREALWHAIIRKNHGCTHFIVGQDHASPVVKPQGEPFYGLYEAQDLFSKFEDELGVTMLPFRMLVYVKERDQHLPVDELPEGVTTLSMSASDLRARLDDGREIPSWFTFPDVVKELRRRNPPRHKKGFTVFFTGLSGSGKSTIANVLRTKLLEAGGRSVTLLDGDIVRRNLSSELGFSREHRDLNILRIGFVASEITKGGGIALCAPIAPYAPVRKQNRELVSQYGGYVLVHVSTPIEVCESRDRKGLYAKARAGIIKDFTGVSDPYETPEDADVDIDTSDITPEEAAQQVYLFLEKEGYIGPASG